MSVSQIRETNPRVTIKQQAVHAVSVLLCKLFETIFQNTCFLVTLVMANFSAN